MAWFRRYGAHYALALASVVLVAAMARSAFVLAFPEAIGDSDVYLRVALNLVENGCLSVSDPLTGVCAPSWGGNQPPGLPIMMALADVSLGSILGRVEAIGILQALISAGAIGFLVFSVDRSGFGRVGALSIGLLLALSPLHVAWSRLALSEALAVASTILFFAFLARSVASRRLHQVGIGLAILLATSVRYDAILLTIPLAAVALADPDLRKQFRRMAVIAAIVGLPLVGWSTYGVSRGLTFPPALVDSDGHQVAEVAGFFSWLNTWMHNEYELAGTLWPVLTGSHQSVAIPERAFVDPSERGRVNSLVAAMQFREGIPGLSPDVNAAFEELAEERRRNRPWERWIASPLVRTTWMTLNPFSSFGWPSDRQAMSAIRQGPMPPGLIASINVILEYPLTVTGKALPLLYRLLLYAGVLWACYAFALGRMRREVRLLFVAAISLWVARVGFFGFLGVAGPETRYLVEALPLLEITTGLAILTRVGGPAVSAPSGTVSQDRSGDI